MPFEQSCLFECLSLLRGALRIRRHYRRYRRPLYQRRWPQGGRVARGWREYGPEDHVHRAHVRPSRKHLGREVQVETRTRGLSRIEEGGARNINDGWHGPVPGRVPARMRASHNTGAWAKACALLRKLGFCQILRNLTSRTETSRTYYLVRSRGTKRDVACAREVPS